MARQFDESLLQMVTLSNTAFARRRELAKNVARLRHEVESRAMSVRGLTQLDSKAMGLVPAAMGGPDWRSMMDAIPTPLLVGDMNGDLLAMNLSASLLTGYGGADLGRLSVLDVVAARPEWTISEFSRFVRDGEWRGDLGFKRHDGSVIDLAATAGRVEVGAGSAFFAPLYNISQRTRVSDQRDRYQGAVQDQRAGRQPLDRLAAELREEVPGMSTIDLASMIRAGVSELLETKTLQVQEVTDTGRLSDLSEVLLFAVEQIKDTRPNLRLALYMPRQVLIGPWDQARLERAISMLLNEAVSHSRNAESITVTATDNTAEVRVSITNESAYLEPDVLRRLASLHPAIVHSSTSANGAPYLARLLIERQGGRIWLELGAYSKGFSLNFSLPRWPSATKG